MKTSALPAEPGLRERKKQARRAELIDAAQHLVGTHGLDQVTVEAICARAGVSARTFFNYFDSKDDAVMGYGPWSLDHEVTQVFVSGGPTGRLGADLEQLVIGLVDRPLIGRERIARAMELARSDSRLLGRQVAAFERHHQQIARLVAQRLGLDDGAPCVETLTLLVMTLTRAAYARWESDGGEGPVRDVVPTVVAEVRDVLRDG